MKITLPFNDAPEIERLKAIIIGWRSPELLGGLESLVPARHEVQAIGRLYNLIRANVKRGRVFDLGEVLLQGSADCLGYAKLFTLLGRLIGLDSGVVEVVIDNGGRYVPHTAVLVRLKNRRVCFVDLWYGSKNIRHKRIGLQVKRGSTWKIEDIDLKELSSMEEVYYLPDSCVDAITLYIRGNRYLNSGEFGSAIRCYSEAIKLYPSNARFFYNRAVAYENSGERRKAETDYTLALRDDSALIRVLAREDNEVVSLLNLDASGVDNLAQEMFLLHEGFTTGRDVRLEDVARRFSLTEAETRAVLSSVEAKLARK